MKRIACYIALMCILASCGTTRHCICSPVQERTVNITDSVIFQVRQIDVPLPAELASGRVAIKDTSVLQTSLAEARAWVEDGQLHQELRNRSDQLLNIKLDVPVYIHTEKEYLTRTVTKEVEKPLGWFRKTLMYAGAAALMAAVALLVATIIRH